MSCLSSATQRADIFQRKYTYALLPCVDDSHQLIETGSDQSTVCHKDMFAVHQGMILASSYCNIACDFYLARRKSAVLTVTAEEGSDSNYRF